MTIGSVFAEGRAVNARQEDSGRPPPAVHLLGGATNWPLTVLDVSRVGRLYAPSR